MNKDTQEIVKVAHNEKKKKNQSSLGLEQNHLRSRRNIRSNNFNQLYRGGGHTPSRCHRVRQHRYKDTREEREGPCKPTIITQASISRLKVVQKRKNEAEAQAEPMCKSPTLKIKWHLNTVKNRPCPSKLVRKDCLATGR